MTKIYSLNGEDYFDDFGDIITDEAEVGGTYWEADKKTYAPSHFFHFGGMLEALREQAFEVAGDFRRASASSNPSVTGAPAKLRFARCLTGT